MARGRDTRDGEQSSSGVGGDDRDRQGVFDVSRGRGLRSRSGQATAKGGRPRKSSATQGRRAKVQNQGKDTGRRSARGKGPRRGAAGKRRRSGSESNAR